MILPYGLVRPLLFRLPPEKSHAFGLWAARTGGGLLGSLVGGAPSKGLEKEVAGLRFPNPVASLYMAPNTSRGKPARSSIRIPLLRATSKGSIGVVG